MLATLLLREEANDGRDRGPKIIGIACGFLGGSMLIGLLRLGLRCKRGLLSWDDACIVMALMFSTMQTIVACKSESWGYGKPIKTLSKHEISRAMFWFYLAQIAYKGSIWPSKVSMLILYNRVFGDSTQQVTSFGIRLRTSLAVLITFGMTFFLISEIVTIFTCVPVQRYWDKTVPGKCQVNPFAWWFAQSILNTVSDVFILLLPMPLIKDLQIPRRQKIGLMLVFAVGIFITVCTIIRMTTFKTGAQGSDSTYDGAITLMWSLIETNVSIICACLPLLRPLISRLFPSFGKSHKSRSKDRSGNTYSLKKGRYGLGSKDHAHHSSNKQRRGDEEGNTSYDDAVRMETWEGWKEGGTVIASTISPDHKSSLEEDVETGDSGALPSAAHHHHHHHRQHRHYHHHHHRQHPQHQHQKHNHNHESTIMSGSAGSDAKAGITKQTDVEVTTETASEHGSQRGLTAGAAVEPCCSISSSTGGAGGFGFEFERASTPSF